MAVLQIDPNLSKVAVPDERFDYLVEKFRPKSVVPAVLTVTDIAGLVKGAAEGAGLGNAFLSHIQAVDGIYHMCRGFANDEVIHVEGAWGPSDMCARRHLQRGPAVIVAVALPHRSCSHRAGLLLLLQATWTPAATLRSSTASC